MRRISLFVKSAVFTAIIIPLLYVLSLGRYERAEHWLSDVYFAKEYRAAHIVDPRFLAISNAGKKFIVSTCSVPCGSHFARSRDTGSTGRHHEAPAPIDQRAQAAIGCNGRLTVSAQYNHDRVRWSQCSE
jgi:hypothetical protein